MIKINKRTSFKVIFFIYCIAFFIWWVLYEFSIKIFIESNFDGILAPIIGTTIKLFTWTIPCVFMLKKYENEVSIPLNEIFTTRFKIRPYILLMVTVVFYLVLISYIEKGSIYVNDSFKAVDLIGAVIFVGITEEMVFRGWILNVLLRKTKVIYAVIISSILFLIIHFPIWIVKGVFYTNILSGGFITVFLLGIFFSMLFIKSRNLLVPIVFHMMWNLFVIII